MNMMLFFPGFESAEGSVPGTYVETENEADYQAALAAGGQPVSGDEATRKRQTAHGLDKL